MKLIYVNEDLIKTINITFIDVCNYINTLSDYKKIGQGTYCNCYQINTNFVLKVYTRENIYDTENECLISEIQTEIDFIKEYNNLPYIAYTYFILDDNNHNIYILQELLEIKRITNLIYDEFLLNIKYFIKLLDINIKLLKLNIVNIDIKPTNVGFDKNNNLKIFDFNLLEKIDNLNQKINLYNKYDFYYLHCVNYIMVKNTISYSIAILILESFSNTNECNVYLYTPKNLQSSKYILLNNKKKILPPYLYKLLYTCFQGNCTPMMLLERLLLLYNK
jgi:hypothetical protein